MFLHSLRDNLMRYPSRADSFSRCGAVPSLHPARGLTAIRARVLRQPLIRVPTDVDPGWVGTTKGVIAGESAHGERVIASGRTRFRRAGKGMSIHVDGGFGEVYLVENPLIHRRAAVKVLHTELARDAELVRRFLNEARAASAIQHPNMPGWGRLGCGGWSVRRSHPSI